MQLLPSIRSIPDRDQLTTALMLRRKEEEEEEESIKQHAIASLPSHKASTDPNSALRSIKTGEYPARSTFVHRDYRPSY